LLFINELITNTRNPRQAETTLFGVLNFRAVYEKPPVITGDQHTHRGQRQKNPVQSLFPRLPAASRAFAQRVSEHHQYGNNDSHNPVDLKDDLQSGGVR
jgi:hypothetical protein